MRPSFKSPVLRLSSLVGAVLLLWLSFVATSMAQSVVTVRSVDEGQVNRLIFYISGETNYQAERQDNQLVLNFNENLDFDFASLSINPLPFVSNPVYSFDGTDSIVTITLSDGVDINHFRQGSRLVVEVNMPVVEEEVVAEAVVVDEVIVIENDTGEATEDSPAVPADEVDEFEEQLNAIVELGVAEAEAAQQALLNQPDAEELIATAPVRQIRPTNIDLGEVLAISMENGLSEQVLVFSWRFPVGAAVFKRGEYLWVIFDEESSADLVAVQPFLNDRILSAEQASDIDQTLFRFQLKNGQGVVTERQENNWVVRISDAQIAPVMPISLARQENIGDNFRIFVPLDNPGPHLRVLDPVVGDVVDVIPVFDGGMGSARERVFAQFKILPSSQGLVLNRTSDQVVVSRFSNGVAIGGVTNLAVSLSPLATDLSLRSERNDED
ncbi:MAG: hypothetical protein KAR62_06030, partial [Sphingomonadales bacterium]|nr:hypothetical protein [Sphingomonadales bacterium]